MEALAVKGDLKAVLLPRDRALNVRLGLALLVVGLAVVFVAFSGNQAYDMTYFYVAFAGSVLTIYGAVLLAHSRVVSEQRRKAHQANKDGPREWVRLQCPSCSTTFDAEGVRPFTAVCPNCASSGMVQ
jgi:uncharacterized membrane protein YfcA